MTKPAVKITAILGAVILLAGAAFHMTVSHFDELTKLTWIDIINAGAWILVVLVLQLEIFFGKTKAIFKPLKISLYTILFMCLLAWFFYGGFLDIWDAALWLIAFFFIEMNVVAWREEIAERKRFEGVIS